MHQSAPIDLEASGYRDNGHAWTLAYQREINTHLAIAVELLQVDSRLNERLEFGDPETALERQLELVVRARL
jgi:hypothetical protein